ncbi:c-type cytochrome [Thalassotalea fusca]
MSLTITIKISKARANLAKITLKALITCGLLSASLVTHANTKQESKPSSFTTCIACHGVNGEGNAALNAPVIAGQSESYLLRQLTHFKKGIRGANQDDIHGATMRASIQTLKLDNEIPKLAGYIAQLPAPELSQELTGDLKNGSRYYQAKCGACHGGQAQGNEAFKAPRLSGQSTEYLQRQMQNFVRGVRGSHREDKLGRQMAMMAKTVTEAELNDIIYFISLQK